MSDKDYILISNLIKDFYENLKNLFVESMDEDLVQLLTALLKLFAYIKDIRVSIPSMDIKKRKTIWRLISQAPQKDYINTEKRWFLGLSSLVIR